MNMVSNTEILNRLLNDSNVLNIYMFGSMVYGSNNIEDLKNEISL